MLSFLSEQTYEVSKHGFQYQGRFITSFIINKDTLAFASKDLSVKSPARKDVTDSKTVIPSDTFTGKSTEGEN